MVMKDVDLAAAGFFLDCRLREGRDLDPPVYPGPRTAPGTEGCQSVSVEWVNERVWDPFARSHLS